MEPFAGSGTALLEAEACGVESIGLEPHPFVWRVAQAKLRWNSGPARLEALGSSILDQAAKLLGKESEGAYAPLIAKCFPPEVLHRLSALKRAVAQAEEEGPLLELAWLALVGILRECSPVGTAQWQYVLPNKTKAKVLDPLLAFDRKIKVFSQDMRARQLEGAVASAVVLPCDARTCEQVGDGWADFVVTSPPYANNYDYADATRLEMSFLGEISGWGDLQSTVRHHLIRSCSQQVAKEAARMEEMLQSPLLAPIAQELIPVCQQLGVERLLHGGKKNYHAMIAAYFQDMARVWFSLRRATRSGARVCFVIGDSAPCGIYVPVEKWLGELALAAGFHSWRFEKLRERNTKWKNRKHRVLLQEGLLWVEG